MPACYAYTELLYSVYVYACVCGGGCGMRKGKEEEEKLSKAQKRRSWRNGSVGKVPALFFQKTQVGFPSLPPVILQLLVTPTSGDPIPLPTSAGTSHTPNPHTHN